MEATSLRAAVVQVQSDDDLDGNLARCDAQLQRAAAAGARLVVLPENFAYFGNEDGKRALAEAVSSAPAPAEGPIVSFLRRKASQYGVTILAGGMPERSADPLRPYNSALVVDATGYVSALYRKAHLFDVTLPNGRRYHESATTTPGAEPVVANVEGHRVGLSICYDLRFGALYAALAAAGATILTVPAAFTEQTGEAHWHVLLRARAIEWQCWVLAAAQWGEHPGGRKTFGHALIVDPWGRVVGDCGQGPGFAVADLDMAELRAVRERLPCASHRREFPKVTD